jgi:hypothetical protein
VESSSPATSCVYSHQQVIPLGIAEDTQLTCVKFLVRTVSSKAVKWGCHGLVGPRITADCIESGLQVTVNYSSALSLDDGTLWI